VEGKVGREEEGMMGWLEWWIGELEREDGAKTI